MKVGVIGARGRMGLEISEAIASTSDLSLVACADMGDDLRMLVENNVDVVVDVTNVAAARQNIPWLALHGIHAVIGTTGFTQDDIDAFDHAFKTEGKNCFIVPNFSIGAVLMMQFAEQAAQYFDGVEIIELHHDKKKDAPSGTAQLTADRIAAAKSKPWVADPTEHTSVIGVRGGEAAPGIHLHSVRLPGLLAHQEVIFGSAGQTLTIRHDSFDRSSFMPGVLRAVRNVAALQPGVTFGLDAVL